MLYIRAIKGADCSTDHKIVTYIVFTLGRNLCKQGQDHLSSSIYMQIYSETMWGHGSKTSILEFPATLIRAKFAAVNTKQTENAKAGLECMRPWQSKHLVSIIL